MHMIASPVGWGPGFPPGFAGCGLTSQDGLIGIVPNLTSGTGGTALITPSNGYIRGVNYPANSNEAGPRYAFASPVLGVLLGAAQARLYLATIFQETNNNAAVFNDTTCTTTNSNCRFQSGTHPRYNLYDNSQQTWQGNLMAAKILERLAPCLFEPRSTAPDYGSFFESAVRLSSTCNVLMVQSLADAPLTRTIDLTPIAVSGQATTVYCAGQAAISVTTVASGTLSYTNTFDPDACALLAAVGAPSASAWYTPVPFNVCLSDVSASATQIRIEWSYSPLQFTNPTVDQIPFQGQTISATGARTGCASYASGTAPIDPSIPFWYRILYLDSSNNLLAKSDVQH
jgi:hypothetical protein